MLSRQSKALHFIAALLIAGCNSPTSEPSLSETVAWMQNALKQHNGQRLDSRLSKEVKLINNLTADHCGLRYELSNFDISRYDLTDIDTNTIKIEKIGGAIWVTFKTRNFHHSVHYEHPLDKDHWAYDSDSGGFSLDSEEVGASFSKALTRAVVLCGGKPSTF
jgi:hypothetical protein